MPVCCPGQPNPVSLPAGLLLLCGETVLRRGSDDSCCERVDRDWRHPVPLSLQRCEFLLAGRGFYQKRGERLEAVHLPRPDPVHLRPDSVFGPCSVRVPIEAVVFRFCKQAGFGGVRLRFRRNGGTKLDRRGVLARVVSKLNRGVESDKIQREIGRKYAIRRHSRLLRTPRRENDHIGAENNRKRKLHAKHVF